MLGTLTLIDMVSKQLTIRAQLRPDSNHHDFGRLPEDYGPLSTGPSAPIADQPPPPPPAQPLPRSQLRKPRVAFVFFISSPR